MARKRREVRRWTLWVYRGSQYMGVFGLVYPGTHATDYEAVDVREVLPRTKRKKRKSS
jgi:hypothetical protein